MKTSQYTEDSIVIAPSGNSYLIGGITSRDYGREVGYDFDKDHPIYAYDDICVYSDDFRLYFINNDFYVEYGIYTRGISKGVYKIYSKDRIKVLLNEIQNYYSSRSDPKTNCSYAKYFPQITNFESIYKMYDILSKRDDSYEFNKFNDLFKTIILYENTLLDNSFDMGIDEAEKYLNSLNDVLKYSKNKQEILRLIDEVDAYISYLKVKQDMNVLSNLTCDHKIYAAYENRWIKPKSMENALWISEVLNSTSSKFEYDVTTLIYWNNDFYFVSKEKDSDDEFNYKKVDSFAELKKFFNNSFVKDEITFNECLNKTKDQYKNQFNDSIKKYNDLVDKIKEYEEERINSDNKFDVNCFTLLVENNDFDALNNLIINFTDKLSKLSLLDDFYINDTEKKLAELRIKNFIEYLNNLKELMLLTKDARELNIIDINSFINRLDDNESLKEEEKENHNEKIKSI